MPRARVIDDEPDRYCQLGTCGKLISKQKPGGKWKTPAQYRAQKGCCVECSRKLRTKTMKATKASKLTGQVKVTLSPLDMFLQRKR